MKRMNSNVNSPCASTSQDATKCASTSQDATKCEACETILNSKNFIKTLRHCSVHSSGCSYHRELFKFLQRKINDLKRRK